MSAPSPGPTPCSSTSSQPSRDSSTIADSTFTPSISAPAIHGESSQPSGLPNKTGLGRYNDLGVLGDTRSGHSNGLDNTAGASHGLDSFRRHRPGNSGGFLLDPTFTFGGNSDKNKRTHSRHVSNYESRSHQKSKSTGYGSEHDSQMSSRRFSVGSRKLGGSPLATVATASKSGQDPSHSEASSSSNQKSASDGIKLQPSPPAGANRKVEKGSMGLSNTIKADPMQIVNLALNLSESRRKGANAVGHGRIASPGLSASQPPLGEPFEESQNGRGSLKYYLQNVRQPRGAGSPGSRRSRGGEASSPPSKNEHPPSTSYPHSPGDSEDRPIITDATRARAEKAKAAIELAAEYRRLLQYVPPINPRTPTKPAALLSVPSPPSSPNSSHEVSRVVSASSAIGPMPLGRAYNPLQAIRNRKVRNRERRFFDAEAEGWGEVGSVKAWVDQVENEVDEFPSNTSDSVSLPFFEPSDSTASDSPTPHDAYPAMRTIKRSRMDWKISPAELLADTYWLEQEKNKAAIENKRGQKIFPAEVKRSPREMDYSTMKVETALTKQKTIDSVRTTNDSINQPPESEEASARGRRRGKVRSTLHGHSPSDPSRHRHFRRHSRQSSTSSSPSSLNSDTATGKKHGHARKNSEDEIGSRALEKHMMEMLEQEARETGYTAATTIYPPVMSSNVDPSTSLDLKQNNTKDSKEDSDWSSPRQRRRSSSVKGIAERFSSLKRGSIGSDRGHKPITLGDGPDLSVTNSPEVPQPKILPAQARGNAASVKLNNSVPSSRDVSPMRKITSLRPTSQIPLSKGEKGSEGDNVSENDFAMAEGEDSESRRSTDLSRYQTADLDMENYMSSGSKVETIKVNSDTNKLDGSARARRAKPEREPTSVESDSSRFRGMFRAGRIEEMLRSEVSKVGDMIWRRAGITEGPLRPILPAMRDTDGDIVDDDTVGQEPSSDLSRVTTTSNTDEKVANPRFTYHLSNLPSFKSTSKHDSGKESPKIDHITRQQLFNKENRKSPRFGDIAPPKIDMDSITSPTNLPQKTPRDQGEFEPSQKKFSVDKHRGVREADSKLNAALGLPGTFNRTGPPVTSLAALSVTNERRSSFMSGKERHWSITDRGLSPVRGPTTRRDIARVRALLASSGIKAQEICRKSREVAPLPDLHLKNKLTSPLQPLPRVQSHLFVARIILKDMELSMQLFEGAAKAFRGSTVRELHKKINAAQERVSSNLTPLVRAAADDADAFSTELATTHTIAINQLNTSVDTIMRRRRRKLRWIRRAGYVLLEWAVLGVMWAVWLIVMIIRTIQGILGSVISVIRWLFWF